MKKVIVTGATGSFGNTIVRSLIESDEIEQIVVFSRDELKQDNMKKCLSSSKLKFFIGDVRDIDRVREASRGMDAMFCAAALKQVPSCELYPSEAVKTNVLGTENSVRAAIENGLSNVVVLSTDKAVYPINAMGISKAMMEKVALSYHSTSKTKVNVTRYGNVMGSRGSVIPYFHGVIRSGASLPVTDIRMTRFMMSLDESVDLVLEALASEKTGEIFVRRSSAADMQTLIDALSIIEGKKLNWEHVGIRPGEKLHETLVSAEEMRRARSYDEYFVIEQMKQTTEPSGENAVFNSQMEVEFTSANCDMMNAEDLAAKILKCGILEG